MRRQKPVRSPVVACFFLKEAAAGHAANELVDSLCQTNPEDPEQVETLITLFEDKVYLKNYRQKDGSLDRERLLKDLRPGVQPKTGYNMVFKRTYLLQEQSLPPARKSAFGHFLSMVGGE